MVPFAMESSSLQIEIGQLLIGHHKAREMAVGIPLRLNAQSLLGGRVGDEMGNDFVSDRPLAAPVESNLAKHPVLTLVPFAGARRKVTDRDGHPQLVGQPVQGDFPQPTTTPITAPAISRDQQVGGRRVNRRSPVSPPAPKGLNGKLSGVVISSHTDPAGVERQIRNAVGGLCQVRINDVRDAHPFRLPGGSPFPPPRF